MSNFGQTNVTPQKHGKVWTVRVRKNGQRVREVICPVSGPGALSKVERRNRAPEILNAANEKKPLPVPASPVSGDETIPGASMTLQMSGDAWLINSQTRRKNPIRPNTVKNYSNTLQKFVYPVLGKTLLSEITNYAVKDLIDHMVQKGCSTSVINDAIMIIQQIVTSIKYPRNWRNTEGRLIEGQPVYFVEWDRDLMDAPKVKKSETKAFTAEQIQDIIGRAKGQYKLLWSLMGGTGLREGEALAIKINGDPDKVTTLSDDWRVLHIRTIILQDGSEQDRPKSEAGIREVDIAPELAAELKALVGSQKSGYLFSTESGNPLLYSNVVKNVFDPILWDQERPIMKREGKGWKRVGTKVIPGVIGKKADLQDKVKGRTGYGTHSFRRFRETYLRLEGV